MEEPLLNLAYENSSHLIEALCASERLRRQRVKESLQRHQIDELHEELVCSHDTIEELTLKNEIVQAEVAVLSDTLENARIESRMRCREVDSLKVCSSEEQVVQMLLTLGRLN